MFSVFRRRTASTSRSDTNVKENSPVKGNAAKANSDNSGFITPTLTANGSGTKHRTLSGVSISSSSTSLATSPLLNVTRQQEKHELQTLNDRLAVIIDTVRRLEQDNEKLRNIVKTSTQSFETETSKVKALYESELDDAKKLIEELAHEKSRLEIELEKHRCENNDLQSKLTRTDRDTRGFESRLRQYENEIADLKARCNSIASDTARKMEENQNLESLNNDLEKQIVSLKRQLESETLLRIDLENKNKTLREQLEFNEQVHETHIKQIREQQCYEVVQSDGLRQQYDDKILQELQQLRAQNEQEIISLREDIASQYEKRIEDLYTTNRRQVEQITNYRADLASYRERIEEAMKTRDACTEKMVQLEQRCRELEDRTYQMQQQQHDTLIERDEELQNLKALIEQMQIDYQNLLDTKIGLDREISTYRKLLDSEEERLNIGSRLGSVSSINASVTSKINDESSVAAVTPTTTHRRNKRARVEVDDDDVVLTSGSGR
ncbi:unnamed protein product [Rotaria magnacalcarata]|uniref:IF rod domain-containing protein n=1 Tax=Rotaria magnacalcarata TaxID=392030 RepID=A0A819B528_9BILA|nr:unnamed protein product [Rotaria magnacalcarata]CAF1302119.1 unnamed protein product [Rotaria magnacalcarata]CAF2055174.1 unnamed protein product [Rotaria magnacalcarata]CAF2079724.1 unnamed protein product [Rotaria magnacalcarata]CAF2141588.1 unnamed protein product [Rotaria magnacalcarata]